MNAASQLTTTHDALATSEPRLRGHWLFVARIVWVVLTVLIVTLNVAMIPRYDAVLQTPCQPGPTCFGLQLTSYDRQFLRQSGLSFGFVAGYQVALDGVSVLVYCTLAALIVWRKSADRMALFCAFMLVLFGGASFTQILQSALGTISPVWFALVGTLDVVGQSCFLIFFLLFPSGRFVPRWTRWIAFAILAYWIATVYLAHVFYSPGFSPSIAAFFALLFCTVGAQVYRYRRVSTLRERQQTKWVVFGFTIGILGFVLVISIGNGLLPPELHQSSVLQTFVAGTGVYGFLFLVPISIATAILRSRLFDIDVVIRRTLIYGSLSAILAAIYFACVLSAQAATQALTGQTQPNPLILVLSTLLIATLFTPLRRAIQRTIDRRFYRAKYDAVKTLESFAATLRQQTDLADLREHLVSVVEETMQPEYVSLWLNQEARSAGGAR